MSGPKVVRVVTREELVAAGEALLRELNAASAQWQSTCAALGITGEQLRNTTQRRDELEAMLRRDEFARFAAAAAQEIEYLEADAASRRERVAQARAQERARLTNGKELASALLRSSNALPKDVREQLKRAAAAGLSVGELDAILSNARKRLFTAPAAQLSAEQRVIAKSLSASAQGGSLDEWKSKSATQDDRLRPLYAHLSELEMLGEQEVAETLGASLTQVLALGGAAQQMRLDTLIVAIQKARGEAVTRSRLLCQAARLRSEVVMVSGSSEVADKLAALGKKSTLSDIEAVITAAQQEVVQAKATQAAAARRRVILEGLEKLGYQVHEGLSTATPNSGRMVLRSPGAGGYGVEISGGAAMDKVQVRTVAFNDGRNPPGDVQEEQRWCGDFGKLQSALKAQGCDVVIEKALGVGTTPIKVLGAHEEDRRRGTAAPSQMGRTR